MLRRQSDALICKSTCFLCASYMLVSVGQGMQSTYNIYIYIYYLYIISLYICTYIYIHMIQGSPNPKLSAWDNKYIGKEFRLWSPDLIPILRSLKCQFLKHVQRTQTSQIQKSKPNLLQKHDADVWLMTRTMPEVTRSCQLRDLFAHSRKSILTSEKTWDHSTA